MSEDIVAHLRELAGDWMFVDSSDFTDAADEIEGLRKAVAAMVRWANGLDNRGYPPPELRPYLMDIGEWWKMLPAGETPFEVAVADSMPCNMLLCHSCEEGKCQTEGGKPL